MSSIRLIVSDIDGTILDPAASGRSRPHRTHPSAPRKKIPFILHRLVLLSGIAPIARSLGVHQEPIACYNGALIVEGRRDFI